MPPPTPAQLHQASRSRRGRQRPQSRARWLLPLVVVVSALGFIGASVSFAIESLGASQRPRIGSVVGAVEMPAQDLDLTRVKPLGRILAHAGGSFRLTWDDGTLVDIGHGLAVVAARPRTLSVGVCDLGVLVPQPGKPLTIVFPGGLVTARTCRFTAHIGEALSQLQVISGALTVHEDGGRTYPVTAGGFAEVHVGRAAPTQLPAPVPAAPAVVPAVPAR